MDTVAFNAFNAHSVAALKAVFSEKVKFYNDGGGISGYAQTMDNFQSMFGRTKDIRRELVPGAIQTGQHQICHTENGKEECAVFRFANVWQKKDGQRKITCLVTYDH